MSITDTELEAMRERCEKARQAHRALTTLGPTADEDGAFRLVSEWRESMKLKLTATEECAIIRELQVARKLLQDWVDDDSCRDWSSTVLAKRTREFLDPS